MTINFRVEYEPVKIRHLAVQCPYCGKWFRGYEIANQEIDDEFDIDYTIFTCPLCSKEFSVYVPDARFGHEWEEKNVEEWDYPDIYKDCLSKKEVWE